MKWSNRSAQGFSPGYARPRRPPWKWRPSACRRIEAGWYRCESSDAWSCWKKCASLGRHFQGDSGSGPPRAKALGYFLGPFHGQRLTYRRTHLSPFDAL